MRTAVALAIIVGFPVMLFAVTPNEQSTEVKRPILYPLTYNVSDLPVWRNKGKAAPEFAPEMLMKYLRATIEPQSWSSGADGAEMKPIVRTASLVISQTAANHEKIAEVIDSFRSAHPGEVAECVVKPPLNVGDFENGLRTEQRR